MPNLFEKKMMMCRKCRRLTIHTRVINLDMLYWRCEVCLKQAMEKGKIYIPPHVRQRPRWIHFDSLTLFQQFRMFQSKDSRF